MEPDHRVGEWSSTSLHPRCNRGQDYRRLSLAAALRYYGRDADFRKPIVRLETAKGRHKVLDLASRRGFAGFEIALNT
jgi:hypothetical protein